MKYAQNTSVSADRSRDESERILMRYGATRRCIARGKAYPYCLCHKRWEYQKIY